MKVKFEATCDLVNHPYIPLQKYLEQVLQEAIKDANFISDISVTSAEIIKEEEKHVPVLTCPICGYNGNFAFDVIGEGIVFHCPQCKRDFTEKNYK